jgi:hypothetical protein
MAEVGFALVRHRLNGYDGVVGLRVSGFACALLLAAIAAGCGGGGGGTASGKSAATTSAKPASHALAKRCAARSARERSAVARIQAKIARLRKLALNVPSAQSFNGTPAVSKLTDSILLDLATAPISKKKANRLIDRTMGALVGSCQQCFQALEAARPIPEIKYGANVCPD